MNNLANLFKQCYIPLLPIHACMHATNPPNSYQVPHTTHAQQMKTRKPLVTNIFHLNKYKQQNLKNAPYNMMPKPTQIA